MGSKKSIKEEGAEVESTPTDTQLLKAIEGLKQELNLARSNICIIKAVNPNGQFHESEPDQSDPVDIPQSIAELGESLDSLCIQETAQSYSAENATLQTICCMESVDSELRKLLNEYISNELHLTPLSEDIREEYWQLQEAKIKCFQCLQEYMANEKEQRRRLQEDSHSENKEAAYDGNRKLKEIRFMQLIIPRIISQNHVNFEKEEWLARLCRKIRDPILSAEDLL